MGTGEFTDYFVSQCEHVYVSVKPIHGPKNSASSANILVGTTPSLDPTNGQYPTMFGNTNVYGYLDDLTATETKLLKKCLGDSDGDSTNNVEVYDWDYGATSFYTEQYDTWVMSGTPHAIKLVRRSPNDDYDGGKFALVWWNPKAELFYVATKPSDLVSQYAVFTTDATAERVYLDVNTDSAYNQTEVAATAYFKQFSNQLYMSFDTSCETGLATVEPCLQKGDMIFITDANWGKKSSTWFRTATTQAATDPQSFFFGVADVGTFTEGFADTTDLYTITKIWKAETTGSYTYVSQCSNRGLCNSDDALCECFKGYTND